MLQTCDAEFVSRRRGRGLLMLDVARNMGRNMVPTGGGEERLLMLDVTANRVRNRLASCARWTLDLTADD
jgi:hypothetical protein